MTENQKKVQQIANALFSIKVSNAVIESMDENRFLNEVKQAALELRNEFTSVIFMDEDVPESHGTIQGIRAAANKVVEKKNEINDFISRAIEAGFLPPDNPISEIEKWNQSREVVRATVFSRNKIIKPTLLDEKLSDDLIFNLNILLDLIEKEKAGKININKPKINSSQLSSYDISLSGYDISLNDGATDLISFLPDIEKIKRARLNFVVNSLNFKNRIPKILFTLSYDVNGINEGTIIGWRKILDASSYKLKKKNVFTGKEITTQYTTESAINEYEKIKDYVKKHALSFYNQFDENDVIAVLDSEKQKHSFYVYTLTAEQNVRTDKNFVFEIETTPLIFASLQLKDIKNEMKDHVNKTLVEKFPTANENDLSPYPFLSKKLYGHDKFDWILAATNVKAAIDRGDDRATVRKYSYIGSDIEFLSSGFTLNKIYKPSSVNEVMQNIKESITTFGVSQTLLEIVNYTGLNFFFNEKESPNEDTFKRATELIDETELGSFEKILSAIDSETATVDVAALLSNLIIVTQDDSKENIAASATEIYVPGTNEKTQSEDALQFVSSFDLSQEIIDLTTFDGISEFLRTIRLFFDLNPGRAIFGNSGG